MKIPLGYRLPAKTSLQTGFLLVGLLLAACAHLDQKPQWQKKNQPEDVFHQICSIGKSLEQAKGKVWLKLEGQDEKGQLPASVLARRPSRLVIEVMNLAGGREALIEVENGKAQLELEAKEKTYDSKRQPFWRGMPIRWARGLFLGQLPCPQGERIESIKMSEKGLELKVENHKQKGARLDTFRYQLTEYNDGLWPEKLLWKTHQGNETLEIRFAFFDPESETRSPLKWSVASSKGKITVQWRRREIKPE